MAQCRAHTKIPGKASAGGLEVGTAGHFPAQDLYELDAGDLEVRAGGSAAGLIAPFVVGKEMSTARPTGHVDAGRGLEDGYLSSSVAKNSSQMLSALAASVGHASSSHPLQSTVVWSRTMRHSPVNREISPAMCGTLLSAESMVAATAATDRLHIR